MVAGFFARQFRRPSGLFGRIAGTLMVRGNAYEIGWTVSLLKIKPDDHVLEVGFGPGIGIRLVAQKASNGLVAGVDLSETMVAFARKRNHRAIQAGQVDLKQGDVAALPYDNDSFEKAFAIHSIYFWPRPVDGLKELRRVLKAEGVLAITILPKDKWKPAPPADIFTLYTAGDIQQLFTDAGFRNIRIESSPTPDKFSGISILGVK